LKKDPSETRGPVTISFIGRDIEDAKRLLATIAGAADRHPIISGAREVRFSDENRTVDPLETLALRLFSIREARARFLSDLGEPGWDILLALYVAERSGAKHTIGRMVELSRSSQTTGLRHIDELERKGLAQRKQDRDDRRVYYLQLSDEGRNAVDKILSYTLNPDAD
jgi:DNA-binding MarR family transcriptional regulator